MSFFAMLTTLLASLHIFIFWRMSAAFGRGLWQLPVLALLIAMLVLVVYGRSIPPATLRQSIFWLMYIWMGIAIITALSFLFIDVLKTGLWLTDKLAGTNALTVFTPTRRGCAGLALSLCLCIFAYWQAMNVQPVHLTVSTKKIDSEKNIRIAAISDLHLGRFIGEKKLEKVAAIVRETKPDILVFLGDIVDTDMSQRMDEALIIKGMIPHGGGFAVLGNHEAYRGLAQAMAFKEHGGLKILRNAATESLGITIVGVDDPVLKNAPDLLQEVALLQGLDHSRFILFLRHRPGYQQQLSGLYDLQLAGHTHGGQIWPGSIIAAWANKVKQGLTHKNGDAGESLLYVMNGTGFWGPPMRIGSPPEVLIVDLVGMGEAL